MQKKSTIVTLILMGLVIALGVVYIIFFIDPSEVQKRKSTPAATALIVDDGSPSFTDIQGNPKSVNEHFGKIMVVTSWASWCPSCKEGIEKLGPIASEYKDRDVVVFAVNRAEDRYTAERYLATITVSSDVEIILDSSDHYFKASTGYAMPETIIYTKDGEVDLQQRGNVNIDEVKQHLDELLK